MGDPVRSARSVVAALWAETAEREVVASTLTPPEEREGLQHHHLLRHVNAHYRLERPTLQVGRNGLKARMKRRLAATALGAMGSYLDDEEDLLANLVRLQNEIALRLDRVAADLVQLFDSLRQATTLLSGRDDRLHLSTEERIAQLEARIVALEGRLSEATAG